MDGATEPSMDGFMASPATGLTPPSHGMPAFAVDVIQQVQGCKPCRGPTHTTGMLCCLRFRYGGVDITISANE